MTGRASRVRTIRDGADPIPGAADAKTVERLGARRLAPVVTIHDLRAPLERPAVHRHAEQVARAGAQSRRVAREERDARIGVERCLELHRAILGRREVRGRGHSPLSRHAIRERGHVAPERRGARHVEHGVRGAERREHADRARDRLERELIVVRGKRPPHGVAGRGGEVRPRTRRAHHPLHVDPLAGTIDAAIGEGDAMQRAPVAKLPAAALPVATRQLRLFVGRLGSSAEHRKGEQRAFIARAHLEQRVPLPIRLGGRREAQAPSPVLVGRAGRQLARAAGEKAKPRTGHRRRIAQACHPHVERPLAMEHVRGEARSLDHGILRPREGAVRGRDPGGRRAEEQDRLVAPGARDPAHRHDERRRAVGRSTRSDDPHDGIRLHARLRLLTEVPRRVQQRRTQRVRDAPDGDGDGVRIDVPKGEQHLAVARHDHRSPDELDARRQVVTHQRAPHVGAERSPERVDDRAVDGDDRFAPRAELLLERPGRRGALSSDAPSLHARGLPVHVDVRLDLRAAHRMAEREHDVAVLAGLARAADRGHGEPRRDDERSGLALRTTRLAGHARHHATSLRDHLLRGEAHDASEPVEPPIALRATGLAHLFRIRRKDRPRGVPFDRDRSGAAGVAIPHRDQPAAEIVGVHLSLVDHPRALHRVGMRPSSRWVDEEQLRLAHPQLAVLPVGDPRPIGALQRRRERHRVPRSEGERLGEAHDDRARVAPVRRRPHRRIHAHHAGRFDRPVELRCDRVVERDHQRIAGTGDPLGEEPEDAKLTGTRRLRVEMGGGDAEERDRE